MFSVGYSRPRKGTVGYGRFRFGSCTKEIAAALPLEFELFDLWNSEI